MATSATIAAKLILDSKGFSAGINKAMQQMDKLSAHGKHMSSQLSSFGAGINNAVGRIGSSMQSLGSSITRGVTLPLLAAGAGVTALAVNAVQAGADFEKAMSGVAAILGGDAQQGHQLSELALELGMDPKLIVSASQAASVMEELAKNGISFEQIMGGAARSAIALANATGTEFATAAEIAGTAMALFNIPAEKMTLVTDQVTAVANTSRFTVEDFAQAIGMGGAAARSMSVPFEEFTAVISALSVATSSGSDAGTSFKTFLARLSPVTDKATGVFEDLGIITEETGNKFFDASGNLKSMAEVSGILQTALKDLSEEEKSNALEVMFGSDAMRAAIGLSAVGEQGFRELMTTMSKTDAAKNAATRMDNLAGAIEILAGIVEAFKIRFTQAFGPALKKIVNTFSTFLSNNSGRIGGLFQRLGELFTKFIDKVAKVFTEKNALKIFEFLNKVIDALPEVWKSVEDFGGSIIEIFRLLSTGDFRGGIFGLQEDSPLIGFLFTIRDFFKGDGETSIAGVMKFILGLAVLGPVLSTVGAALPALVPFLLTMASGIQTNGPAILEFFTRLVEKLPDFLDKLTQIGDVVGPQLQKLFDAFINADPEQMTTIVTILGALALLGPPLMVLGSIVGILSSAWGILSAVLVPLMTFITATAIPAVLAFVAANAAWLIPVLLMILFLGLLYWAFTTNFLGFRDIVTSVMSVVVLAMDKVLTKMSELTSRLSSFTPPAWLGVGGSIDLFQPFRGTKTRDTGGSGFAGTPYMIGTGAQPEMFIPSTNGTFIPNADRMGAGGSGGATYNVTIYNPKKETADNSIRQALKKLSFIGVAQ